MVRAKPGDLRAARHPRPGALRQSGRDPTGRVMLAKWVQRGFEAFHEFTVVRGQVANFLDTTFTHNDTGNLLGAGGMGLGGGPGLTREWVRPACRAVAPRARARRTERRTRRAHGRGGASGPSATTPGRGGAGRTQPGLGRLRPFPEPGGPRLAADMGPTGPTGNSRSTTTPTRSPSTSAAAKRSPAGAACLRPAKYCSWNRMGPWWCATSWTTRSRSASSRRPRLRPQAAA